MLQKKKRRTELANERTIRWRMNNKDKLAHQDSSKIVPITRKQREKKEEKG